jgi:hypothetical protein
LIHQFISKKQAPYVVEILAETFKNAIIPDETLKVDVGIILKARYQNMQKTKPREKDC